MHVAIAIYLNQDSSSTDIIQARAYNAVLQNKHKPHKKYRKAHRTMKAKGTQDKGKETLGQFMFRITKRAIGIARREAAEFTRITKVAYDGIEEDLVTTADLAVQKYHVGQIRKWNPGAGLIGEEKALKIEPAEGFEKGEYFTDDPIDGTKAFGRMQSTGISTMLAHVTAGTVDAVCIGDINSGDIYQYAPDIPPTRTRFGVQSPLQPNVGTPLRELYVVLTNPLDDFPPVLERIARHKKGGVFKDMEVTSGSIGVTVARIWKGEVGMIMMRPRGFDTPWDTTPLIGMNAQLGIKHLKLDLDTMEIAEFMPQLPLEVVRKDYVEILIHETRLQEVIDWINQNKDKAV